MRANEDDDYLSFDGEILAESAKAVKFQADFWDEPEWLPRSQIKMGLHHKGAGESERCTVQIKSWLCKKHGWTEA